jgi:hypothetical protein
MLNKTFVLIFFLFVSSCGYDSIHSKKNKGNYNFSINTMIFDGDRDVNLKMKEKLNNYTLDKKDKDFTIMVSSIAKKEVLAKNILGDPTSFKSIITINVKVLIEDNLKSNFQIIESFNYNNNSNKFDLKKYEKEIRNNLAETSTDKLIFKLSNIQ